MTEKTPNPLLHGRSYGEIFDALWAYAESLRGGGD
jgi:hypothetical protein